MTPEQFDRLQTLFLEASNELENASEETVRAWIEARCEDHDVASELAGMLALDPDRTDPLDKPVLEDTGLRDALVASPRLFTPPVIDGYAISREIARGGQSVVYDAIQEATGQRVAIKVLLGREFSSDEDRARQDREVSILTRLSHPNIVGVIDRGSTDSGIDFVVMPFIEGAIAQYFRTAAGLCFYAA